MTALAITSPGDAKPAHLRLVGADEVAPETPRPGRGGKAKITEPSESSQGSGLLITSEEAADILRISAKTLANWRAQGKGPAYRRIGGRVAYQRATVQSYGLECAGLGTQGKPSMQITTRPYTPDPTRHHVDIMFTDPHNPAKIVRKRIVAAKGMSEAQARAWGHKRGEEILYALIRGAAPASVDADTASEDRPVKQHSTRKPASMTCGEYWIRFETGYCATLKRQTRADYCNVWRTLLAPLLSDLPITAIDRAVFHEVKAASRARHHTPSTTNRAIEKLRSMLRVAEEEGAAAGIVIPKIRPDKIERKDKIVYTGAELTRILDSAKRMGAECYVLGCLLVYAGLRIGEAAGLYWEDVDLAAGKVTIRRNMVKGVMQDSPKGEIGTLSLHPTLRAALVAWRAESSDTGPRILATLRDRTAELRTRTMQANAGVKAYGPHRIRHSVITHLVERGQSVYAVQAFARHAKIATTMGYYNHADRAAQAAQAVSALDFGAEVAPVSPIRKARSPRLQLAPEAPGKSLAKSGNTRQIVVVA